MDKMNITDDDIKKTIILQNAQIKVLLNRVENLENTTKFLPELPTRINEINELVKDYNKISSEITSKFFLELFNEIDRWVILKCIFGAIGIVIFIVILMIFISSGIRTILLFNKETYLMLLKK